MVREANKLVWHERSVVPSSESQRQESMRVARRTTADAASVRAAARGDEATGGDGGTPWLRGTRVVDLSNVIAGPTIGGMLARYGATVIKVDPKKPTYDGLVAVFMGVVRARSSVQARGVGRYAGWGCLGTD